MSFKRPNSPTCVWVCARYKWLPKCRTKPKKEDASHNKNININHCQLPTAELQRNKMIRIKKHTRSKIYLCYICFKGLNRYGDTMNRYTPHTHHTSFTTHYPLLLPIPLFCYCFIFIFQYMLSVFRWIRCSVDIF